jgi:hypothetical protein
MEGRKLLERMLALEESQLKMGEMKSASKVTFSAVIKRDALGTKTKLAGTMKESNLSGKIERTPRPDGSGEYNTVIFFTGSTSNTHKMTESLKQDYMDNVIITPVLPFELFKNVCISQTPAEHHRQSGSSGDIETLFKLDPDEEDSIQESASFKSDSSRGSAQTCFKNALVHRDTPSDVSPVCALCQSPTAVQGAHIYPVNAKRSVNFNSTSLHNKYDTCNGLLLCSVCHGYFDNGYWWIVLVNGDYFSHLSDALKEVDETRRNQHLAKLRLDSSKKGAPDNDCLLVQANFCEQRRQERLDLLESKPWGCEKCCSTKTRYATEKGLQAHYDSNKCILPAAPQLFTPNKSTQKEEK